MEKNELYDFCEMLKELKNLTSLKLTFYNDSYFFLINKNNY